MPFTSSHRIARFIADEPAATRGIVTAVVSAAVALLVAFGLDITDEQTAAIIAFVAVVAPLVATLLTRGKVTPVDPYVPEHRAEVTERLSPAPTRRPPHPSRMRGHSCVLRATNVPHGQRDPWPARMKAPRARATTTERASQAAAMTIMVMIMVMGSSESGGGLRLQVRRRVGGW